jgi:Protein of unknown function (DUF1569)
MSVDTAKVEGRRSLHFNTLDDILADVERLNQGKVRAIGNWSPGQILKHVTVPMKWCLDGAPLKAAWYIRVMGWLIKNRFLRNPMPAGFKLSGDFAKELVSDETSWEDGLQALRAALARLKAEPQRHPSPFLGELTRAQWDQLHCRHCELHLSFLVPDGGA